MTETCPDCGRKYPTFDALREHRMETFYRSKAYLYDPANYCPSWDRLGVSIPEAQGAA